ncbi:MAG TPA: hypothetical protein VGO80_08405, partial [Solirubrobacteraceae bacterium]|nr:hypothetical protein [Solirubrobacteraceae bacterium]
ARPAPAGAAGAAPTGGAVPGVAPPRAPAPPGVTPPPAPAPPGVTPPPAPAPAPAPSGVTQPPAPAPPADPGPYCAAATRFSGYLRQPPAVALVSRRARAGRRAVLRLSLSKPSYVKLAVLRGRRTVAVLAARLPSGRRSLVWTRPRSPATYTVMLRATDLAGNVGSARGELEVLKARRRHR